MNWIKKAYKWLEGNDRETEKVKEKKIEEIKKIEEPEPIPEPTAQID